MPYSSGVYSGLSNSFNDAVSGTIIDPADWNELFTDIEAGINGASSGAGAFGVTDVASAATTNIGAAATAVVRITGSTGPITSLGTVANTRKYVYFASTPTLTHNASSLILPGGANIVAAAGDHAIFASDASGNWRCFQYGRASEGWVGFLQSGTGTTRRTWTAKARDFVSVKDFGALGDNSNDDTAEIQAAIDAVATAGGGTVFFPRGKYKISSTLNIRVGGVFLAGEGAFYTDETASSLTRARAENASQIVWDAAAAGSKMIRFFPNGPDDDTPIRPTGGGMRDLFVDGSNDATHCIEVLSWVGLQFFNVHCAAATTVGWNLGTYTAGATDSKYTSGYHSFYNITYMDGGNSSDPLAMWGAAGLYNTCLCQFFGGVFRGNRISIGDADSNYFYGVKWGATLRLEAQGTSPYSQGNYYAARNNVFFGTSGLVIAKAQTSSLLPDAPHSCNNFLIGHTNDAGAPLPTIEAGADLTVWVTSPVYLDRKGGALYGNALMGTKVQLAATQAISNGSTTAVTWPNPSSHNPLAIWASGNATRLTVPNGIKFVRIQATADFAADIDGERYADIYKNGTDIICRATGWPLDTLSTAFALDTGWIAVEPGDYFELRVNHTAGANLNLNAFTTNMTMDVK